MRARLCVSASHTDEQIDLALKEIEAVGKEVGIPDPDPNPSSNPDSNPEPDPDPDPDTNPYQVGILYERRAAQRAVRLGLP